MHICPHRKFIIIKIILLTFGQNSYKIEWELKKWSSTEVVWVSEQTTTALKDDSRCLEFINLSRGSQFIGPLQEILLLTLVLVTLS